MLIDHQDQQSVLRKAQNLKLCFGTYVGTHPAKIEKISISQAILKISQENVEGTAAARARSRAACRAGERVRRSKSTYAQLVDMQSRIVEHNRLCLSSTIGCALRAQ